MELLTNYINDQSKSGRNITAIIDVSGTSHPFKYYTQQSIGKLKLKYKKVTTKPRETITDDMVNNFCSLVDTCFSNKPNTYILVHCTHGVNRTGFYICNYLVRMLSIPVHIALAYFAISRQVALYDPFLIELLFEMNKQKDSEMYRSKISKI
jgi:protein tyrosine phosphatase